MPPTPLRYLGNIVPPDLWTGAWLEHHYEFKLIIDAERSAKIYPLSSHKRPHELPIAAAVIADGKGVPIGYGNLKGFPDPPHSWKEPEPVFGLGAAGLYGPDSPFYKKGFILDEESEKYHDKIIMWMRTNEARKAGGRPLKAPPHYISYEMKYKTELKEPEGPPMEDPTEVFEFTSETEKYTYLLSDPSHKRRMESYLVRKDRGKYSGVGLGPQDISMGSTHGENHPVEQLGGMHYPKLWDDAKIVATEEGYVIKGGAALSGLPKGGDLLIPHSAIPPDIDRENFSNSGIIPDWMDSRSKVLDWAEEMSSANAESPQEALSTDEVAMGTVIEPG
jgi:hypothetical protein